MIKIIDEKGRLFGKINVIDFLVILFLLFFVPMFYFRYKLITKKSEIKAPQPVEFKKEFIIEIDISCLFVKLEPKIAAIISVGDKELDKDGQFLGEIIEIGEVSPYVYNINVGAADKFIKEDPILKQVKAKLKLKVEILDDNIYYKKQQILKNGTLEFITDKYKIQAVSLSVIKGNSISLSMDSKDFNLKQISLDSLQCRLSELEKKIDTVLQLETRLSELEKKIDSLKSFRKKR